MSMSEVIRDIERDLYESTARKESDKLKEFLNKENKHYIFIHGFFAQPMNYEVIGIEFAANTIPVVTIEFENGKMREVSSLELMKYDTFHKCQIQCEKLNKDMRKHREARNKSFPYGEIFRVEYPMQTI